MANSNGMFDGLPDRVLIGAFWYKLEIPDEIKSGDEERWGEFDSGELAIRISKKAPTRIFAADIMIHEIAHAVWRHCAFGHRAQEEQVCAGISSGLVMVLAHNLKLKKWIMDSMVIDE